MLISPEYLELQKALHTNELYGTNSANWPTQVKALLVEHAYETVLDYGCGKGRLKDALGNIVAEYDPAIEGKDGPPQPADLIVCTDVLEHIEPECLDNVLEHIRSLANKAVLLVIPTIPATKNLADGRNAHLIIEGEDWWRKKLESKFDIKDWECTGNLIVCYAKPYLEIGEIVGKGVLGDEVRNSQMKVNCAKVKNRVRFENPMTPNDRVAILMCYGPSLEDTWQAAAMEKHSIPRTDIISVSGAHDYLVNRGIIPKYHVECDPRKHKGEMLTKPHRDCTYLMASCVHPSIVDMLLARKRKVKIWHLNNGEASVRAVWEIDGNQPLVGGGGSVGLRSIPLLYGMGYRRFIIHGMDCSYKDETRSHAGLHSNPKGPPKSVEVVCGDRKFITAPVLISYLRSFDELRAMVGDTEKDPTKIEIILRGDGLLRHALITGGAAEVGPAPEYEEKAA